MKELSIYRNFLFIGFLLLIIVGSFIHFAPVYYYFLNSDHAVHVLMTANFRFPSDLYFWGQDRLGSLIPLLAHLIYKSVSLDAVWSVSIANYIVLIAGYFSISSFVKSNDAKLLLAVFWFFPPFNFIDFLMIAQPFGVQMSLVGIAIFIYRKIDTSKTLTRKVFLISLISVLMIVSLWVSDLTVISAILLIMVALFDNQGNIFRKPALYIILFWVFAGYLFIYFAKSNADQDFRYTKHIFNDLHSVLITIGEIGLQISDILTFDYESNIFLGIFGWLSVVTLISVLFIWRKHRFVSDKWFWFFAAQATLALLVILVSHWVFRNGISRRYFVLVYISVVVAVLLISDKFTGRSRLTINMLLIMTALAGLLSSTVHIYYPERKMPVYEKMKEFKRLGKAGIIAEYWNSYITAIAAPDEITVTPHDKSYSRNRAMSDSAFKQPHIYIIKDLWLENFPETISQYGYLLKKSDEPFELGGATLCEYKLVKTHKVYTAKDVKSASKKLVADTNSKTGEVIESDSSLKFRYLVYGPFIDLNKGKYKVIFYLRSSTVCGKKMLANIEVTTDYGKSKLATRSVIPKEFADTLFYRPFDLKFEIDTLSKNIEFRVYYIGKNKLWFDYLELNQLE